MGLFGFACGRCWDKNCSCTPEELKDYEERCKNRPQKEITLEKSVTEPFVTEGDIIVKDDTLYFVRRIEDGKPVCVDCTSNSRAVDFAEVIISEPYEKMKSVYLSSVEDRVKSK